MAYEKKELNDKIWVSWGEDLAHLQREEYTGKRSVRALEPYFKRKLRGGQKPKMPQIYIGFIEYESPHIPLTKVTITDLFDLGVLRENMTKNTFTKDTRYGCGVPGDRYYWYSQPS